MGAQLLIAQKATESSSEVMRKRKEEQQRQQEQEKKWKKAREEEELRQWALSFGVDGDDAATKIQKVWKGGVSRLLAHKAQQQVQVETYTSYHLKPGAKKTRGKIGKELDEINQ